MKFDLLASHRRGKERKREEERGRERKREEESETEKLYWGSVQEIGENSSPG